LEKLSKAAVASNAALALSVVLLPWYSLGDYEPTGWDATWWARVALACAVLNLLLLRARYLPAPCGARVLPVTRYLAMAALAVVLYRTVAPPDFGFAFNGLEVGTEREYGLYVALALSLIAAVSAQLAASRSEPVEPPGSAAPG
jgi:hypothetical protein